MKERLDSINNAASIILNKLELWLHTLIAMLPNLLLAAIVIIGFIFLSRFISKIIRKLLGRMFSHHAINDLITTIVRIAIIFVGFFIALDY